MSDEQKPPETEAERRRRQREEAESRSIEIEERAAIQGDGGDGPHPPTLRMRRNPADVLRYSPFRAAPKVKTGFPTLDRWTEGGIPFGASVGILGAPGCGKTTLAIQLARAAREQYGADVLGAFYDEGDEGAALKLGPQIGIDFEKLREADPEALKRLDEYCLDGKSELTFLELHYTLAEMLDLMKEIKRPDRHAVLVMDTLQKCRFELEEDRAERFRIEAIVDSLRSAALALPAMNLMTSEVNRASYASPDKTRRTAGLAAGAESRAIEYGAELLLFLTEVEEEVVNVEVAKNRIGRGQKGHIRLRHDRPRARYTEIDREASEQAEEELRLEREAAKWSKDEAAVKKALRSYPGRTERALRPHAGIRPAVLGAHLEELARKGHAKRSPDGCWWPWEEGQNDPE